MNIKSNYIEIKNGTAKCKLCERIIKTSGNTSNMSSHLKNKHNDVFVKCAKKKLSTNFENVFTITESFKTAEAFKDDGFKTKEITDAIVFMICKDNMTVRCVEKEGLQGHQKKCVPHFKTLLITCFLLLLTCFLILILDKIKRIVMHFKHSTAMMDLLRKAQADEGTPEGKIKTLVQNIDTRWNSCLDMMQAFLNLANKVAVILINKSEHAKGLPEMLNSSEITICRELCSLLQPRSK
ncbi:uncharacterized protein LOC122626538 [Drosophila teissieri]|uniref:uncharacterized protein LOC122626538 n=1 Tax=Drosophila teissieri TaxID=7243 RepID=UPI001CBA17D9|nr:uncharacterized protein LOC122626538 [Drosophila teissieri]